MLMTSIYGKRANNIMNTDIRENDKAFEVIMDLPGFRKEDLRISLDDGYMTVQALTHSEKTESDKDGSDNIRYIRRERYSGTCSRSFYVGSYVKEEDITASFEGGVLTLSIAKKTAEQIAEQKKYIAIAG